jgi:hypothetical protein
LPTLRRPVMVSAVAAILAAAVAAIAAGAGLALAAAHSTNQRIPQCAVGIVVCSNSSGHGAPPTRLGATEHRQRGHRTQFGALARSSIPPGWLLWCRGVGSASPSRNAPCLAIEGAKQTSAASSGIASGAVAVALTSASAALQDPQESERASL